MDKAISCSHEKCTVSDNGHCYLNNDPISECPNLVKSDALKKERSKIKSNNSKSLLWSGDFLTPQDLEQISKSNSPQIIGIIGTAEAGKTSYLGMLYTLLLNGRFLHHYKFAGSLTLTAWERLSYALQFHQGGVLFPETTPSNPGFCSLYHLKLKFQSQIQDILFADASGEVFSQWGINRNDENAEGVRWIHDNANGFIFFIDCEALIERRAEAKEAILDIALQLNHDLGSRPVAVVWSKADKIEQVRSNIRSSLKEELSNIFRDNYTEYEVSNYTFEDPDLKCHENNLATLNWLLQIMAKPSEADLVLEKDNALNDLFINYR